jgi:hypothetical protein
MEKLIRDGKVGVLVSPGFGGGFYTWGAPLKAIFDPTLVEMADRRWNMRYGLNENGKLMDLRVWDDPKYIELTKQMIDYVDSTYTEVFSGGVEDLEVVWVPEGSEFIINDYDGSESLQLKDDTKWLTA